ncbi:uncharacterized protein LOC113295796 [Papaver somniferum]|uniref:uncharacterized protein LOC113295796 n=1 Tax=Papaver somniferum TaxID=3469 RepID=UPI000E6F841F|nr:uncharacterized protein LOC113295796 [Papaver somniferum]
MEDIHPNCPLDCNEVESIEHMLFFCHFAKEVWASEPHPIQFHFYSSVTFLDICKEWLGKQNTIIPVELALTKARFIWKERCNLIFENKHQPSAQLSTEIKRHLEFWYKYHPLLTQVMKNGDKNVNWIPPEKSQLKINIDAAWILDNLPAGFSLILRNDAVILEQGRAGALTASTPEEAEALGLLQGAKWAVEIGLSNFSLEGDCKNLFDYLNGNKSLLGWQNIPILDEAVNELKSCNNFLGFHFVPRSTNSVADLMAKEAKNFSVSLNWRKKIPECIKVALEVDKSNVRVDFFGPALNGSTQLDVRVTNSLS